VVAGLLLTGGASSRMGAPKATLLIDGEPLGQRAARLLASVCDPVLEVGPGHTSLPAVTEPVPGQGPLAALVAGVEALGTRGRPVPVLLLACDLPRVTAELLQTLATWPGTGTVVPLDGAGEPQAACARYSTRAQERARAALAGGARALRTLLDDDTDVTVFAPADERVLADVDTPQDAARWGVQLPGSLAP
jgi:molybdopterin-guanine dinucleotide biosynthesis protein A